MDYLSDRQYIDVAILNSVFFNWNSLLKNSLQFKAEETLQGMESQQQEAQKDHKKEPTVKRYLLVLNLKPLRSYRSKESIL